LIVLIIHIIVSYDQNISLIFLCNRWILCQASTSFYFSIWLSVYLSIASIYLIIYMDVFNCLSVYLVKCLSVINSLKYKILYLALCLSTACYYTWQFIVFFCIFNNNVKYKSLNIVSPIFKTKINKKYSN